MYLWTPRQSTIIRSCTWNSVSGKRAHRACLYPSYLPLLPSVLHVLLNSSLSIPCRPAPSLYSPSQNATTDQPALQARNLGISLDPSSSLAPHVQSISKSYDFVPLGYLILHQVTGISCLKDCSGLLAGLPVPTAMLPPRVSC